MDLAIESPQRQRISAQLMNAVPNNLNNDLSRCGVGRSRVATGTIGQTWAVASTVFHMPPITPKLQWHAYWVKPQEASGAR
jgi:hypothetical protein